MIIHLAVYLSSSLHPLIQRDPSSEICAKLKALSYPLFHICFRRSGAKNLFMTQIASPSPRTFFQDRQSEIQLCWSLIRKGEWTRIISISRCCKFLVHRPKLLLVWPEFILAVSFDRPPHHVQFIIVYSQRMARLLQKRPLKRMIPR